MVHNYAMMSYLLHHSLAGAARRRLIHILHDGVQIQIPKFYEQSHRRKACKETTVFST